MDTTTRDLERAHEADPFAWRPLLAALLRAGRGADARAMLEATVERLTESGRELSRASQMEAICRATDRLAFRALVRVVDESGRCLEAIHALEEGRTGYAAAVASCPVRAS